MPRYIVTSIGDFFKNFDWSGVSRSLGELLGSAVKGAIDLVGSIWDMLKEAWGNLTDYFNEYIEDAGGNIIAGLWNGIIDALKGVGSWIKENIFDPFIDGFKEAFGIHSPSTEMKTMGGYIVDGLLGGINGKFPECMHTVKEWAGNIKDWFTGGDGEGNIFEKFKSYGSDIVGGFREKVGSTYGTVKTNVDSWTAALKEWFSGNGNGAINNQTWTTYADNIISGFREKVGNTYTTVRNNISTWANDIRDYFTSSSHGSINGTKFATFAADVIDGFKGKIGSYYTTARGNMTTWASDVISAFQGSGDNSLANRFKNAAKNVVDGFSGGITSFLKSSIDTVKGWADSLVSAVKDKLGIHSPSRVFSQLAEFTVQGFNKSIDDKAGSTAAHISEWMGKISNITADIKTRVNLDDSALRAYRPNLNGGLSSDTIRHTIQETVESRGNVAATLEASGGIKEAFSEVIGEMLTPYLDKLSENAEKTAHYSQKTADNTKDGLTLDGYKVNKQLERVKADSGYSFTPALV